MYTFVLTLHSWMRWLIILSGVLLVLRAAWGWLGNRDWHPLDERLTRLFPMFVDIQLLLGLILFVALSPNTSGVLLQGAAALSADHARFWAMEHALPMIGAILLAHVGQIFVRRSQAQEAKYRWATIVFGLAVLIILFSVPWPFARYGRPLFRLG